MRTRSTGLGSTELIQEVKYMKPTGDYLIMGMQTVEPVKWQVRAAMTYLDFLTLMKVALKPAVIWWVIKGGISGVFTGFKNAKNPRPLDEF